MNGPFAMCRAALPVVEPEESAELIRLVAFGEADELAGEPCSIYDPAVRARLAP